MTDLQAHLDGGVTTLCRCWRIDRADGVSLGLTDHDTALSFDALSFEPGADFDSGALESGLGLAADNTELAGALTSDTITEADLDRGVYDGAEVRLWLVNWSDPAARALLFRGTFGEVTRGRGGYAAELRARSALLDQTTGRAFVGTCDAELGDARCAAAVAPASATLVEAVAGGGLRVTGLSAYAQGWFARGAVEWTSGVNLGLTARIRAQYDDVLYLWAPPPDAPAPGDTLSVMPGCDKRLETCRHKFGNTVNFRGFPHIPGTDWVVGYPLEGGGHDGGRR